MSHIVTWWDGGTRLHRYCKDEHAALETAMTFRQRSDALVDRSLVPIRVMPQAIWDRMQALEKARNDTRCKHGLLRQCVKCLSSGV